MSSFADRHVVAQPSSSASPSRARSAEPVPITFLDLSLTIERGLRHEATPLDFGACLSTRRCDRLPIGFELKAFGYDEPNDDWAA